MGIASRVVVVSWVVVSTSTTLVVMISRVARIGMVRGVALVGVLILVPPSRGRVVTSWVVVLIMRGGRVHCVLRVSSWGLMMRMCCGGVGG